ncbi:MAG TPA: DUF2530 domain-containing protein, partial [Candidatus Nanopelagicales bacterium]|nr:DUF2530 domain-containing protein [Candidatus Nanopelagicales bacterium]
MAEPTSAGAEVAPLDVDGVRTVAVGTLAWAVAAVVALLAREQLVADGRGWWVWVAITGTVLGLLGLPYLLRRRRRLAR